MTSPQLENGYTKIANEILEALAKIRISGEARQMLDVIIRKTYGFNKKIEAIPTSKFVELTGLSPMAIYKARKKLLELNLITISQKGESQILNYSFQKNHKDWKPLSKKEALSQKGDGEGAISQKGDTPSPKKETPLSQKGDTPLPKRRLHPKKKLIKRNLSKETIKKKKIKLHSSEKRRYLVFSNPDVDICKHFLTYIKKHHKNKVNSLTRNKEDWEVYEKWLNDIRLLNNKGYDRDKIMLAMKKAINDDFWRNNFYTISKLNTKNKHGILFIDVFLDIPKSQEEKRRDMWEAFLNGQKRI